MSNKKLRVFEAFAGVGSQSMALRNIGVNYEVVGISEVDRYAILAYDAIHNDGIEAPKVSKDEMLKEFEDKHICYNFSTDKSEIPKKVEEIKKIYDAHMRSKNYGDIRLINPVELPDFDMYTYSFPCKNISVEGKQDGFKEGKDMKSSLVWECKKIIEVKKPKYLMMENVKNIVSKRHKPTFDEWCEWLKKQGYTNYWKIYNSNKFNVPQNRERVIMISILDEENQFNFPYESEKCIPIIDIIEKENIDKYIIPKDKTDGLVEVISKNKLKEIESVIMRDCILYTNKEHKSDINKRNKHFPLCSDSENDCVVLVREATQLGYKIANVGDTVNLNQKNSKTRRGRIGRQESKTLDTSCNQAVILEDFRIKRLSPLECWRLQGIKDEHFYKTQNIGLPESKLYERAGRAITIPVLENIFKMFLGEYIC